MKYNKPIKAGHVKLAAFVPHNFSKQYLAPYWGVMCKEFTIRILILLTCVCLWFLKYFTWFTPNNVLIANGHNDLVSIEFTVSLILGLSLSIHVYRTRLSYRNKYLYWANQALSLGLILSCIGVILMVVTGVLFFGM